MIFCAKISIKHKMAVFFRNSVFLIDQLILSIIIIPILMFICVVTLDRILIGIISLGHNHKLYLMCSHSLWIISWGSKLINKKILIKLFRMIKKMILTLILKIMKISFFLKIRHKFNSKHQFLANFLSKKIKKFFNLMIFITRNSKITY